MLWYELVIWGFLASAVASFATIPSVLLQRQGRPHSALSWILAIVTLPVLGLLVWWLLGRTHLERKRRRRRQARQHLTAELKRIKPAPEDVPQPRMLLPIAHLPEGLQHSVFPPSGGNRARVLVGAPCAYEAWLESLEEARDHVHFLFYGWQDNETGRRFRDRLAAKAKEGVEVRVLYDPFGSPTIRRRFLEPLIAAGAKVCSFLPVRGILRAPLMNFRNHRKIFVVDGRVAYLGGINIGDEYLSWRDFAVKLQGPVVDQVQEVFADDWFFTSGEDLSSERYYTRWREQESPHQVHPEDANDVHCAILGSGPEQRFNAQSEMLFIAINQTTERLWIMTPYLVPNAPIRAALRAAVYRGVDVRLLVPAKSDVPLVQRASRSYYSGLLHAGVQIFEYLPEVLHAKSALFDSELTMIGSANMDTRSFRLNFEVSALMGSRQLNQTLATMFLGFLEEAKEITLSDYQDQSWFDRLIDSTAHLLSPLL